MLFSSNVVPVLIVLLKCGFAEIASTVAFIMLDVAHSSEKVVKHGGLGATVAPSNRTRLLECGVMETVVPLIVGLREFFEDEYELFGDYFSFIRFPHFVITIVHLYQQALLPTLCHLTLPLHPLPPILTTRIPAQIRLRQLAHRNMNTTRSQPLSTPELALCISSPIVHLILPSPILLLVVSIDMLIESVVSDGDE
ncbi:hypothetical protein BLNAU_17120 [Blattamonas nauphoetae]|uniref:Uncharacterized protein n=1 Tax=Blattamonas nauphoetae TaxID=2049346 RepID=A0ABQ9X7U8_9EUKA|nr:hypothetical protein BLNAU_17120 [Blattamonas nauphoetae]